MNITYYDPRNLVEFEATFNYVTKAGAGFAVMQNNEQAFISARMVQEQELEIGDVVRMWCADNFANPETAHFASRWRAIRIEVINRISDILRGNPNVTAKPVPMSRTALAQMLDRGYPMTLAAITNELKLREVDVLPELSDMHRTGGVAVAKIYSSAAKTTPDDLYYAKDVQVFYDHLETPLNDGDE